MSGEGSVELGIGGLTDAALVAAGGFGRVFRARQEALGRWVAVKVLHGVDDASRRRFDRERRAMGRLSEHPGIVTIYESGLTDRNEPYLVMALLEAGSYQDRLDQDGPLDWNDAATTVATAARTIADAHHAGIIHRDLKPANILVSATNTPLITDFGIARLADTDTTIGPVSLTPAYSPPEVLAGEEPSPASDVYALGATLYTLIAGRPAFTTGPDENWLDVIERARTEPIPDLPAGPAGLSDTIRLAMAKDPSQRPNPTHLADLLDRLAANPDTPVVSATITTPTPKRPRRRIALAATTAILLLTAATTAIYLTQQQDPDTTTTQPTTNPTPPSTTTTAAATTEEDTIATPAGVTHVQSLVAPSTGLAHTTPLSHDGGVSTPLVTDDAVWVTVHGADLNLLVRLDPATGTPTDRISLDPALAEAGVEREVTNPLELDEFIWVAAESATDPSGLALYKIDPQTRKIVAEADFGGLADRLGRAIVPGRLYLHVVAEQLWLQTLDELIEVDPVSLRWVDVIDEFEFGRAMGRNLNVVGPVPNHHFCCRAFQDSAGRLWMNDEEIILRVDTARRSIDVVADLRELGIYEPNALFQVSFGEGHGALWLTVVEEGFGGGRLLRIDPTTATVTGTLNIVEPDFVEVTVDHIVVLHRDARSVSVIDPDALGIETVIDLGVEASQLLVTESTLWAVGDRAIIEIDQREGRRGRVVDGLPVVDWGGWKVRHVAVGGVLWLRGSAQLTRVEEGRLPAAPRSDLTSLAMKFTDVAPELPLLWLVDGIVWARTRGSLTAIEPWARATGQVIDLPGEPISVSRGGGKLWALVGSDAGECDLEPQLLGLDPIAGDVATAVQLPTEVCVDRQLHFPDDRGMLWVVQVLAGGGTRLTVVDPVTGKVAGVTDIDSRLTSSFAWRPDTVLGVTETGRLFEISMETKEFQLSTNVGEPGAIDAGADKLWFLRKDKLFLVEKNTGNVSEALELDPTTRYELGAGLTLTDVEAGELLFFDSLTSTIGATVAVGDDPSPALWGYGALWVADANGLINRIDWSTRSITTTVPLGGPAMPEMAVAEAIWATSVDDGMLYIVDALVAYDDREDGEDG